MESHSGKGRSRGLSENSSFDLDKDGEDIQDQEFDKEKPALLLKK